MTEFYLKIKLLSDALVGSGESFGANIDSDIYFDDFGLPYIPAKRIKGCLKDTAQELINSEFPIKFDITSTFGTRDEENKEGNVVFSNLFISDYADVSFRLGKIKSSNKTYKTLFNKDSILENYTYLRSQTAIDSETLIAQVHSLRTNRVLCKDLCFYGKIKISRKSSKEILNTIALAVRNFRYFGTMRNRGLGKIECQLLKKIDGTDVSLDILKGKVKVL
ncbi:MAG: hypothetical protein KA146_08145 [Leptospiraceae bacterium]|nr:hypothetical protein [Leptospiraceae bacterium]